MNGRANVHTMHEKDGDVTETADSDMSETKGGMAGDRDDMYRMNKQQELRRNFRFLSIFEYSLLLGNGWVIAITNLLISFANGGSAGMFWIFLIVTCGMCFCTLTLAELSSMAPTA